MRTLVDTTDEAEPVIEKWMADYTSNAEPSLKYSSSPAVQGVTVSMPAMAAPVSDGCLIDVQI